VTTTFPEGSYAFDVALQPDGRIVAAGTVFVAFNPGEPSNTDFALARYNPDGTPDTTFGNGGQVSTDFLGMEDDAFSVLIQPDGKIVAVGSANDPATFYDFAAVRYLSNGTLDTTFGVAGKVHTDFGDQNFDRARSAALQPNGRIVAAGFAISQNGGVQNFAVARYTSNGILDTTFSGDGKTQIDFGSCCQSSNKVLLQSNGKIIIVGYPNSESSDSDFLLARLTSDGSLDPSFGAGGKVRTSFGDLNGGANGAVFQADGKIVAVGFQATGLEFFADLALARYLDAEGLPLPTPTPTVTPTATPTATQTPTPTPRPTATPTPTPTSTVQVIIQTNPVGRTFRVDGTTYSSAQTFTWPSGSSHTVATTSPQSGSTGVRYVWTRWSDNGAISHTVAPTTNKVYTATFSTQYHLTMSHGTGGTVSPTSGWRNSGASVSITAIPATGYSFSNWTGSGSGSFSGPNNPASITMGGPITETATFTPN
jgi:uncharacterized delta-60 repeat protein